MNYSGMAFELVALLLVAVFLGKKLDKWLELDKPYLTLALLILFLIGYLARIYYSVTNEK